MKNDEPLAQTLSDIQERNARVEADKAWETSWTRRCLIAILTYSTIALFFVVADFPKPFINAIVPTLGFLLSTLSLTLFRHLWLRYIYQKR